MRDPASTDKEILAREINETELALADISQSLGCTCIIDPTETLADRVRHLGMIAVVQAANLNQLRARSAAREVDKNLDELEAWWFRQQNEN